MSDTTPAVEQKVETQKFETEKKPYVRYVGKIPSVSHSGSNGKHYFFSNKNWILIDNADVKNYESKAKKNSHNWELIYKEHTIYEEVHKIQFKGTEQYKEEITLSFDDEKGEKSDKYIFKVGNWTIVENGAIAKKMSDKALQNSRVWAYQLDKVKKKVGA